MTDDFFFTEADKVHPLWLKLKEHLLDQLIDLRERNDKPLDELETAMLRGQIKQLRNTLALGEDQPVFQATGGMEAF